MSGQSFFSLAVGRTSALLAAVLLAGVAGCSSGGDSAPPSVTPPPTPTIAASLSSSSGTAARGASVTTTVSLTRGGNYSGDVSLSAGNVPSGVSVSFSPASLTGSATTATATISVGATAAPGTSTITVSAAGTGVTSSSATYSLTIPTPAITMAAGAPTLSVVQGTAGNVAVTLTRVNGYSGDITLSASGMPSGVTATFAPATVSGGATTSTLVLAAGAGAATGASTITITASGTDVASVTSTVALTVTAAATPALSINASPAALAITAAQNGTSTLTIARTGGFAGDVALAVTGAPAGMTATAAPSTVGTAATTATLTVQVTGAVAAGTYPLTITASGTGVTPQSTTVSVTVAPVPGFSLAATASSVQQGATGTSTITITRTGSFAGAITLSASNLPSGVTAVFSPDNTTGNSSTLTFTATGGANVGAATVTITGTAAGLTPVTATLPLTVTSAPGGSGNVDWTFCDSDDFPIWFAAQNGTGSAWVPITPTGTSTRVYNFTVSGVGGVAYAQPISSGGVGVVVQYLTQAEMVAGGQQECVTNPAKKNLTGTVAGLSAGQSATVAVGNASGTASANGAVAVNGVPLGTTDLFASRLAVNLTTFAITPDRAILRRGVNYATTITPTLDFLGGDSFALASAPYTVTNTNGEPVTVTTSFITTFGTAGSATSALNTTANPVTVYGVPSGITQAGDLHQILVSAITASGGVSTTRNIVQYNRDLAPRTLALGPALTPPTITSLGGAPYTRFSASGSWQSEYADGVGIGYTKTATASNSWTMSMSRGYVGTGAATWSLVIPDFSGVSGFNAAWGLGGGPINASATASGTITGFNTSTGRWNEGGQFRAASRTIAVTP